jgi:hypothetical protein
MTNLKATRDVIENTRLCAEQGWKASFHLSSGEVIEKAYITGTDWEKQAVSLEKVGERHLPPRIVFLNSVVRVEVGWA